MKPSIQGNNIVRKIITSMKMKLLSLVFLSKIITHSGTNGKFARLYSSFLYEFCANDFLYVIKYCNNGNHYWNKRWSHTCWCLRLKNLPCWVQSVKRRFCFLFEPKSSVLDSINRIFVWMDSTNSPYSEAAIKAKRASIHTVCTVDQLTERNSMRTFRRKRFQFKTKVCISSLRSYHRFYRVYFIEYRSSTINP